LIRKPDSNRAKRFEEQKLVETESSEEQEDVTPGGLAKDPVDMYTETYNSGTEDLYV
jgi:hypothetical protein